MYLSDELDWIVDIPESQRLKINGSPIDYATVPVEYMKGAVARYLECGIEPGDFLTAFLCNNLRDAFGLADLENQRMMCQWVYWFSNYTPWECWGGKTAMRNWIERRRCAREHLEYLASQK